MHLCGCVFWYFVLLVHLYACTTYRSGTINVLSHAHAHAHTHTHTHTHTHSTLMSLDTTVHLTVFQAGTFRESFIGYHSIFLGGFKLTNKPTSHWYKLGSRPGKPNTKLRGDILVTITFYSDWKPVIRSEGSWAESRFKRSMSLRHSRSEGLPTKDEATNGKDGRGKGSLLGVSLRRKKSSGGTEDCNEFSSFKSTVATTTTSSTSSQASVRTMHTPQITYR